MTVTAQVPPGSKLPLQLHFGWGLGTLGLTAFMVGSYLLVRFMTDYMGVEPAVAGTIFALAKIYDGIADPIFGSLSDKVRSRWGRRRPFLLAGAFACGITFVLAFNTPVVSDPNLAAVMFAGVLMLHATSYAIFAVPYMAMPAEMTDEPQERSKLMSFRAVNGSLGNFIGMGTAALISLFGGGLVGHRMMAVVIGLTIFAVLMGCFLLTKRARIVEVEKNHPSYLVQLREAWKNKPFVVLQCSKLMLLSAGALHTASAAFFVQRRLEESDVWLFWIGATLVIGTILAQPLWLYCAKRFGKRNTFTLAGCFAAIVWMSWLPWGPGTPFPVLIVIGLLAGFGNGGIVMVSQSMLPDTLQFQRIRTGMRVEGSFAGIYIMVEKLGQAIGASVTGFTLAAFGYVSAKAGAQVVQPERAVMGVTLCYCVISALFLLASVAIMRFYPLDERTMRLRKDKAVTEQDLPDLGTTGGGA